MSTSPSVIDTRRDQMFPVLEPFEIERLRRFGKARLYDAAAALAKVGELGIGLILILSTALLEQPKRLVYVSSGMHRMAQANLTDITWDKRNWAGSTAYAESKLYDVLLAFAIARHWRDVLSNALEPGWVATRMGGPGAPDDIDQAHLTQAWLAVSNEPAALVTGQYFYHMRPRQPNPQVHDTALQDTLLDACQRLSGVKLPV